MCYLPNIFGLAGLNGAYSARPGYAVVPFGASMPP
jgi:hypothetical protein